MRKLFLLLPCVALMAQTAPPANVQLQNGSPRAVTPTVNFCSNSTATAWAPCTTRESFPIVAANVPSAPVTVFGGDYVFSQTCTTYGTLTFQVRGPDGVSYITMFTKTASDTGNATGIVLGSYAVVRVTVTGTAGCNAILARVPA